MSRPTSSPNPLQFQFFLLHRSRPEQHDLQLHPDSRQSGSRSRLGHQLHPHLQRLPLRSALRLQLPQGIYNNVRSFLSFAARVEQIGVSAYVGAVPYISDPAILEYAATIATVEARHSAYLYALDGQSPFPNGTEPSLTPTAVYNSVRAYLGNCPATVLNTSYNGTVRVNSSEPVFPQYANVTRQLNSTYAASTPNSVNISDAARVSCIIILEIDDETVE